MEVTGAAASPRRVMQWIDFPDDRFVVNGLPWWDETKPKLQRLPDRMKERVRPPVWDLAQSPSGARIRFATDATDLALRLHYPSLGHMNNMPRTGQLGVEVRVDGEFWKTLIPAEDADLEAAAWEGQPAALREVCLYLGLYGPVEVRAIGVSDGASVGPPSAFAVEDPVAYYGSSITQGGCASRPGMSYQAILSRALNLDFVNLGFSGNGRGEPELAEAMAEIDACCYVIDFAQNCPTVEELGQRYQPFLEIIRAHRAQVPMVCVTPIFGTSEVWGDEARNPAMREVVRQAVMDRKRTGDERTRLVEGFDLLGPDDRDGLVDAAHPNDLGFTSMATGLEPVLREVLGL